MDSILEVPSGALAQIMQPLGTLFADTWELIALAIGIPVSFYVIGKVVALVRQRG